MSGENVCPIVGESKSTSLLSAIGVKRALTFDTADEGIASEKISKKNDCICTICHR